ncbi:hypothetical protein BGZ46_002554 [Entomortierella lignicola]|nr:hypothetical protein BGZ46_002554 [Entomortierella lignicola]
MPVALSKPEQPKKVDSSNDIDNRTLPCPLYSGYLLKRGSNDRWQSRPFTFDGSVLTCVGKKPKAPVIVTYDPHVSSPFMSSSCSPRPLNPNTKWFINIASVTNIKLLSTTKSYRCFHYGNNIRELSIQTNDGRNIILRARKDIELDRWYFVLSKVWEYQQQKSKASNVPLGARNLVARQQSAHLFQKHLDEQHSESRQQRRVQISSSNHMVPHQKTSGDCLLPYQISQPSRVSQGLDFSLQGQDDGNDIPDRFLSPYYDSQSVTGDKYHSPLERQDPQNQQRFTQGFAPVIGVTRHMDNLSRSASTGMVHQRSDCPAANSMEPEKAAIIDNWRRSLLTPKHLEEKASVKSSESGQDLTPSKDLDRVDGDSIFDLASLHTTDSHDMESIFKPSSVGLNCGVIGSTQSDKKVKERDTPHGLGIWVASNENEIDDNTPVGHRRSLYGLGLTEERYFQGNKRSSFLPGLVMQPLQKEENSRSPKDRISQDGDVQDLNIQSANAPGFINEGDELPLGLFQAKRQSRLLNTQLSEDKVSVIQRNAEVGNVETIHKLLPSVPITPERTPVNHGTDAYSHPTLVRSSWGMQFEHHSLDIHRLTPSFSNPSLSFHGSSYSHLPIYDADFVFPRPAQNAYTSANERSSRGDSSKIAEPDKILQTSMTASTISATDRGLFIAQNFRRDFSIPIPTIDNSESTLSKKYVTVNTTPYTVITTMNSNPPPRKLRHQGVNLSHSLPESDYTSHSQTQRVTQSTAPTSSLATYKPKQFRKQPSLSRSISIMSSVSQAHLRCQSSQSQPTTPYQTRKKLVNDQLGVEGNENEPLGLTLSRQQSSMQQRRLSQILYPDQRPKLMYHLLS